jgi:hypothetical protein
MRWKAWETLEDAAVTGRERQNAIDVHDASAQRPHPLGDRLGLPIMAAGIVWIFVGLALTF